MRYPPPSPLPQTPQAAEYAVLALAARFSHPSAATEVASDCLNVVRAYNGSARDAMAPRRAYAGIMREVLGNVEWARRTTVRKVKAHRDPATLTDREERRDAVDNGVADEAARDALALHPQPSPAQVADLEAMLKRSRLIVRTIAKVTQVFPPMPAERMKRPPRAREGAAVRIGDAHDWIFSGGLWRCRVCMRITIKPKLTPSVATQRCEGPRSALAAQAIVDKGHVLAKTCGTPSVLFCIQCGAFSARRAYGLGNKCPMVPKPSGLQALARIRKGAQPWETRTANGRYRGALGGALAWDEGRMCYVECGPARPCSRRARGGGEGIVMDADGDPWADAVHGCEQARGSISGAEGTELEGGDRAGHNMGRPTQPSRKAARVQNGGDVTGTGIDSGGAAGSAGDGGHIGDGPVRCDGGSGGGTVHHRPDARDVGQGSHRLAGAPVQG